MEQLKLECKDTEQKIEKLPPPFIFSEGLKKDKKKNATCLDYKMRQKQCVKMVFLYSNLKGTAAKVTRCIDQHN